MFSYLVSGYYIIIVMQVKCLNFAVTAWQYSQMLNISKLILHIFINKMKVLILIKMMCSSVAALINSPWNSKFNSNVSSMQSQTLDFSFTVKQSSRKNRVVKIEKLWKFVFKSHLNICSMSHNSIYVYWQFRQETGGKKHLPNLMSMPVLKYLFHVMNMFLTVIFACCNYFKTIFEKTHF